MIDNTDLNDALQEAINISKNRIVVLEHSPLAPYYQEQLNNSEYLNTIDFCVPERVTIKPGNSYEFVPPVEVHLNQTTVGLIQPVNSVGSKRPYIVQSTIVHAKHDSTLTICIYNTSDRTIELLKGEHIAQLVLLLSPSFNL